MKTLRKVKLTMKLDKDLRHTLLKGTKNEILIDLDGDKQAELALMDTTNNGDIDTLAIDLNNDGEFNLYLVDSDHNNIPDTILYDENGDGNMQVLAVGKDVEDAMLSAATLVVKALEFGDYVASQLDSALDELEKEVKVLRRKLK